MKKIVYVLGAIIVLVVAVVVQDVAGFEVLKAGVHVFFHRTWRQILSSVLEQVELSADGPSGTIIWRGRGGNTRPDRCLSDACLCV